MSLKIHFLPYPPPGSRVSLYLPWPFRLRLGNVQVSSGAASFPSGVDYQRGLAFLLRDGRDIIGRSGLLGPEALVADETGEISLSYFLKEMDEPTVISPERLEGLRPQLPMVLSDDGGEDIFRMDELDIEVVEDFISASGKGEYLKSGASDLEFTYEFRLLPNWGLLTVDRILEVETVSSKVKSVRRGFGRATNFIINLILWILRNRLSEHFREAVQEMIDEEVEEQLAREMADLEEGVDLTVTVRHVTINEDQGIVVWPVGLVNLASICPSNLSFKAKRRPSSQTRTLKAMRDRGLRGSPLGERYLGLFERHRVELTRLFMTSPELLEQFDSALERGLKDFSPKAPEKGVMSRETAREATRLLNMVSEAGSSDLRAVARDLVKEVEGLVGVPIERALRRR